MIHSNNTGKDGSFFTIFNNEHFGFCTVLPFQHRVYPICPTFSVNWEKYVYLFVLRVSEQASFKVILCHFSDFRILYV